jgi:hypothetical protein
MCMNNENDLKNDEKYKHYQVPIALTCNGELVGVVSIEDITAY